MIIAINGSRRQSGHLDKLRILLERLSAMTGGRLVVKTKFYDYVREALPEAWAGGQVTAIADGDDFNADMAVSIGGDGTFLRTVQWVGRRRIPILGINTGHLGYLADLSLDEALAEPTASDFKVEDRTLLQVSSDMLPPDFWPYALNEVAILKQDTASMITVETRIGGAPLASYLADGLIISTPTGSTGYNLSVGGPIVDPSAPVTVIAPVAPHSLTLRPLVVGADACIDAVTSSRSDFFLLSLDGRSVCLPNGAAIKVTRAPFTVPVIQRAKHHFASTLREKLLWGKNGSNR
ncbi:MAG: NAD(+)/NADH kinase [Muribaculaceae bacterium]|nr:NAD(+)/NADH kinase [Muribaculaceae bacterium]